MACGEFGFVFGDAARAGPSSELMVENWNRDERDRAGELHDEPVELESSVN